MPGRGAGSRAGGLGDPESGALRPFIIIVFAFVALLLNAYALSHAGESFIRQMSPLLPHLYYIPIILASVWYPRRGILLIGLVVGVSIGMALFGLVNGTFNPLILAYAAIYIWVVATICFFSQGPWRNLTRFLPSKKRGAGEPAPDPGVVLPVRGDREQTAGEDIGSLLATLSIQDGRVKEAAIASLGRSRDPRAIGPLIALLGDENRGIREASVRALGSFGPGAVEPLIAALGDGDWHLRMGAAIALRIIGDPSCVEPLIRVLGDENRFVRREAAKSLGRLGDRRATEPLIGVLGDRDSGVRIRAAAALGKIGDPRAIDPLTRAVSDRDTELQHVAVEALSKIKDSITLSD